MKTILSIDGGGIRGLVPLAFLVEIERQTGRPLSQLFDLMAGTSTGALIASMLCTPDASGQPLYTAQDIQQAYLSLGPAIFRASLLRTVSKVNGLLGPKYATQPLSAQVSSYLPSTRLSQALTSLLVPAYEIEQNTPWFFKSSYAKTHSGPVENPLMADVVLAATAAPSYFAPYSIAPDHCFVDGGIFANNPTLCAYAEAVRLFPEEQQFVFLSLGTGTYQRPYTCRQAQSWGTLGWVSPLLHMSMNASSATVDYQMKALVGSERYLRLQPSLPKQAMPMDEARPSHLALLSSLARQGVERTLPRLSSFCRQLLQR